MSKRAAISGRDVAEILATQGATRPPAEDPGVELLAIDPSIADCGWARTVERAGRVKVIDSGTWHPSTARGAGDRFEQLAAFVAGMVRANLPTGLLDVAVEIPDGGERYFRGRDGKRRRMGGAPARTYAQAVGAVRAAASAAGARVWPVKVRTWNRGRRKEATAYMVRSITGHTPKDHNEADAIGLALWWHEARRLYGVDRLRDVIFPTKRG